MSRRKAHDRAIFVLFDGALPQLASKRDTVLGRTLSDDASSSA
jgi:hypothetical protein